MTGSTILVLLAGTLALYALGAVWYSKLLFGNLWMSLIGKTEAQLKANMTNPALAYGVTFISGLVTTIGIYAAIKGVNAMACVNQPCHSMLPSSAICGGLIGIFLAITLIGSTSLGMTLWEGRPFRLYLLNLAYHVTGFAIVGAIIGAYVH